MAELKERIFQAIKSADNALSLGDLLEILDDDPQAKPTSVRQILVELENERKVIALPTLSEREGRPKNLYKAVTVQALEKPLTRDALESLKLQRAEEERHKLLRELIQDSAGRFSRLPPDKVDEIFKEAATRLLGQNPIPLFLNFAQWLKERYESEVLALAASRDKGLKIEKQEHEDNIKNLEKIANTVFARMLGVPRYLRVGSPPSLKPGPFLLACDKNSCVSGANLDPEDLTKYLGLSIHGATVIEKLHIGDMKPPIHMGGSDASLQPISLGQVLPWFTESADMNIVTAVGVRYDVYKGIEDFERYPDPKALAQYERTEAIQEGLLIPPVGALGFPEEMENRIKEAAMDLRQYRKDFELMFEKEPTCRVHFRDGRIFPLEHRLSDSVQHGLHGDIVRYSLKIFRNIVSAVGTEGGDTLFCGFVKRPGVDLLAPFIRWYMGFGSSNAAQVTIDPGMTLKEFLSSPEGDSWVVSHLFSSVRKRLAKDEVFITFRILRRFQSMEEPFVQNYSPTAKREEWEARLRHYKDEIVGEDSEDLGFSLTSSLCARAAILEFYCSLSGSLDPKYEVSLSMPRFELLVPYPDVEKLLEGNGGFSSEIKYVQKILAAVYYPGVLDRYPDSLYQFPETSPRIFLAPKPVCDAHISAKAIAEVYKDDFLELLVKEAKIYWLSLRKQKWSSRSAT
jgi:hypothetical protein